MEVIGLNGQLPIRPLTPAEKTARMQMIETRLRTRRALYRVRLLIAQYRIGRVVFPLRPEDRHSIY